ncbi:MAG: alpha/beta fold hydrolase [bacterium]|nr:alpha/beta fold hydrolase [bacterium]
MFGKIYLLVLVYLQIGFAQLNIPEQKYLFIADSVKLFYEIMGQGDTLVIIHGGPGLDHTYLLPQLGELADEFTLIFYDQRGTGRSECVVDSNSITLENFVDDLENLRKELKIEKMNLLGHSWGSLLATCYALKYPNNVDRIILTSVIGASSETKRSPKDSLAIVNFIISAGSPQNNIVTFRKLVGDFFKSTFFNPSEANNLTLNFTKNTAQNFFPIFILLGKELSRFDLRENLKKNNSQVLIIHGDYDPIPVKYAEGLTTLMKNSKLVVLKNCGHFPFIEVKEKFISECKVFLRK